MMMNGNHEGEKSQTSKTASGSILTISAECGFFTPLTVPAPGTYLGPINQDSNAQCPAILKPFRLRSLTFKNRVFLSPMAQYSCKPGTGVPTNFHLVHYGQFALRGIACIMTEATAISPNGRMTPEDVGIWSDEAVNKWKEITDFVHSQGSYMGLQLNHAGRRGSMYTPQIQEAYPDLKSVVCPPDAGGWTDVWAPSAIRYTPKYIQPVAMTAADIETFKADWSRAVANGIRAGFDVLELHASHGYLLHNFLSPLSNKREDHYGGSLENRMRLVLEIAEITRREWPADKPVFCRLSVTDWYKGGEKDEHGAYVSWGQEQSNILIEKLVSLGIDFVDVTSGGLYESQEVYAKPAFNRQLAEATRKAFPRLPLGTVGLIKKPSEAEEILRSGTVDVVHIGRELLRQGDFVLNAATEMGAIIQLPTQWHRAITWADLIIPGPELPAKETY